MTVEIKLEGFDFAKIIVGELTGASTGLEAVITNRQHYAAILEFGSGLYNEFPGASKERIVSTSGKFLIVPIPGNKPGLNPWYAEAQEMAKRYPQIMNQLKSKYSGVGLIGFIFRRSIKGMRAQRMVRDTFNVAERVMATEISRIDFTKNARQQLANAVNMGAAAWLAAIVKKTPVLKSNLKTGWNISKLAK